MLNFTKSFSVLRGVFKGARVPLLPGAWNCLTLDLRTPLFSTKFNTSFVFFLFFGTAVFWLDRAQRSRLPGPAFSC